MSFVSNFTDPNTMNNDKIIDRDQLQNDLITEMIDDMDLKTMASLLYDYMNHSYDKYSVDELITEVEEYYPHLMEEWTYRSAPDP